MEYSKIIEQLKAASDEKYKLFHEKLKADGDGHLYGVRVPILREIAKKIVKEAPYSFIEKVQFDSYEEKVLYGLVISTMKIDFEERRKLMPRFIEQIDSWAVCDVVAFKVSPKEKEQMWAFIAPYFQSDREFDQRFAIINSMQNYLDDEYIDRVLQLYAAVDSPHYYVNMAVAWALQVSFIKQNAKTYALFEQGLLSKEIINKAVQKIRDSLRVETADKEAVLKYKIK